MKHAIDIHCHFNHGARFDTEENLIYRCDLEFLKKERMRLNVPICAMTGTFASVISHEDILKENEYLYALAQENPFLYQWVVVDPRNKKTFQQAEQMLKNEKCLGIKIHAEYHGYDLKDYVDQIFSFVNDRGAALLSHLASTYMLDAIDRYPDMKLILPHLGEWLGQYASFIQKARYQNIYTDTSGNKSSYNNVIEYTVQQVGSEKILFGTDTYSCAFQRGRIDYADITEEDKENILYKNALKLFPKLKKNEFFKGHID